MSARGHVELATAAAAAALIALAAATTVAVLAAAEPASATCCYTNPRYSGVCAVQPAQGETCASILEYLNNAASVGKTYCGGTDIRIGWQQVDCEQQ